MFAFSIARVAGAESGRPVHGARTAYSDRGSRRVPCCTPDWLANGGGDWCSVVDALPLTGAAGGTRLLDGRLFTGTVARFTSPSSLRA